jgi:hypothetical protein
MQPYIERSSQVALDSSIAVMVLLNQDNTDMEFWALKPHQCNVTTREEFAARKLRSVGVVGLCGPKAKCAFKERLEPSVINAIATAFTEYLRVSFAVDFAEQTEAAEITELERLYLLSGDKRPN